MTMVKNSLEYTCNDECQISGCEGHKASIEFNSVCDYYSIYLDDNKFSFNNDEMQAVIDLIKSLSYRKDIINI